MDKRDANIDLLFRNGLKDYEVLPPHDVWDGIRPAVRRRTYLVYARAAASIAIVMSLSIMTWMLSRDNMSERIKPFAVIDISASKPVMLAESAMPETVNNRAFTGPDLVEAPEKAFYNSEIPSLGENIRRNISAFIDKSMAFGPAEVPEKADLLAISDINFEKKNPEMPLYPDVKLPGKRWSVSAMVAPTYYSRSGSGNEEFLRMAASENAAASYTGGVGFGFRVNKRISIQTGVYYSSYGKEIGNISSFSGFTPYGAKGHSSFEVKTSNGPLHTENSDIYLRAEASTEKVMTAFTSDVFDPEKTGLNYIDGSLIQNFSYIQMPFTLRYKFLDRNIDLNLLGGISYDLLVGNTAFAKTGAGKYNVGMTEGLNSLLFSSSVGMGVEYNFSEKLSLNFEPTLRYYLNPFNNSVGTRVHPYSIGVFSGFSYKF